MGKRTASPSSFVTERDIEKIGKLSSLSKEEIRDLLNKRDQLVPAILQRIRAHDVVTLAELIREKGTSLDPNRAYVAAILAKLKVNLKAAGHAAQEVALKAAGDATWGDAHSAAWIAARGGAALDAVENAVLDAGWNTAWYPAWYDWYVALEAVKEAARGATTKALRTLEPPTSQEIGRTASHISELAALHWILQNNTKSFNAIFNAAYVDHHTSVTIDQAKVMIARHLEKPELASNLFVRDFNAFVVEADKVIQNHLNSYITGSTTLPSVLAQIIREYATTPASDKKPGRAF